MKSRLKSWLGVEALERRDTPSLTLSFFSGTLTIRGDNLANNLTITETGGNFAVTDQSNGGPVANLGTYRANNLSVTMGNSNDTFTLNLSTVLPGTLTVNMGNGNDSFTVQGPSPTTHARVGGTTNINTGLGGAPNDGIRYGDEVHLIDTDFGGPVTSVTGSAGSATEILDTDGNNIGGTLSIRNIYFTSLGRQTGLEPTNVGQVVINNSQKDTDNQNGPMGPGNLFNLIGNSVVSGSLTYSGGLGRDDVGLLGFNTGLTSSVNGNFTVSGGGGDNTTFLGGGTDDPAIVGGNVTFVAGSGRNRFLMDSGSIVNGSINITLGDGNNQIFGDNGATGEGILPTGPFTVGGSVTIYAGNGNNFIDTPNAGSSINGNLWITLGNGINTGRGTDALANGFTTDAIVFNDNLSIGGNITYRAGTGTNTFEFDNTTYTGNLQVLLSGGNSTVNFGIPDYFGNATIDFGVGFGTKAFETDPVPTTFHGNFVLSNFP